MYPTPDTTDLLTLCTAYRSVISRSEVRIADLAAGNPYFFSRLQDGGGCTIRSFNRVLQWFSDNWPASLEWPDDIPRPAQSAAAEPETAR